MAKVVRDGRLVDNNKKKRMDYVWTNPNTSSTPEYAGYLQAPKKRKGKDAVWPMASTYDMEKSWSSQWDWFTNVGSTDVPNNKKTRVYKEYLKADKSWQKRKPWEEKVAYDDNYTYRIKKKRKNKVSPYYR